MVDDRAVVWFSAMLRFAVLVEGVGMTSFARSLVVFQAPDWPEAKARALELGRRLETSYRNGAGAGVRWRLTEVETLDLLGDTITDGREVYSEPMAVPADAAPTAFDTDFDPASSEPTQSGV
ncbi:MAG TPA: DUF4288 domain-containing protein [Frankiaceae bacterium]|nr:DUF4288 domain-containing protein [Frankiaceae bacterium]